MEVQTPCYSERLDEALVFVAQRFRYRVRKGSSAPYLTHLLAVAARVAEHGADEEQIIAALLHDVLEDIPEVSVDDLRARFGTRVTEMVVGLSDTTRHPKPPWQERKQRYVEQLRTKPAEIKLICTADKLHNAGCFVESYRREGEPLFERFNPTRAELLWYYRAVADALGEGWEHALLVELREAVSALHEALGAPRELTS